jgi:biopolymer transport protein ExbD
MQIQEDKPYDDINITPMLDLAYVLLVIFILMCTASVQGMKVNLPHSSHASQPRTDKPKLDAIVVDDKGNYALNGKTMTLAQIQQTLTADKAATPDLPVVVRGSSATPYQSVMDVLAVVSNLGITQVGLATQPRK